MKLSIIIPVYKVEKYVGKCLNSIFSQPTDKSSYEVIVVDDGSPDNSIAEVEKFSCYNNLVIIRQENKGLSAARNRGIRHAKGDYIWCVDSDDWVYSDSLCRILQVTENCKYDIIASFLTNVDESSLKAMDEVPIYPHSKEYKGADFLFNGFKNTPSQRFIYKRSFLEQNNLNYYEGILHEDLEFCPRALYQANSVYLLDKPIYYYLQRKTGSITSSFNDKNFKSLYNVYNQLVKFKVDGHVKKCDIRNWNAECSRILLTLFLRMSQSAYKKEHSKEFKKTYKEYIHTIRVNIWQLLLGKHIQRRYYKDVLLITLLPHFSLDYYENR